MQVSVLKRNELKLRQGAAVLFLAGMTAGCSSQVARFGGVDDFMTASTPNQREIIRPAEQTYPGDTQPVAAAQSNGAYTGSVSRSALAPVSTAPGANQPAAQPVQTASAPPMQPIDETTTGTVKPEPPIVEEGDIKGWSRAGGSRITVKEGETVYNLSRRFGVPADVIMKSNSLSEFRRPEGRLQDRHPDLRLFGQGGRLGSGQQSEDGESEILARRTSA